VILDFSSACAMVSADAIPSVTSSSKNEILAMRMVFSVWIADVSNDAHTSVLGVSSEGPDPGRFSILKHSFCQAL